MLWVSGDDEQFDYLKSDYEKQSSFRTALGVGGSARQVWSENLDVTPPKPLLNENSGYDVVAEYTDVFRRKFQSKLTIINQYDQELHYGQVRNELN